MADINEGSVYWNLTVKSDDAEKKLKSLSNTVVNLNKLFGLFKVSAFVKGLTDISKTIGKLTEKQMNYIRVQNVFNKTMGTYISDATQFRNDMQSKLGFDSQEIMDSMSTFKRLTETFGVSEKAAFTMSQNLTQLAADLTLYGYSFEEAMSKLRSGISGTIRPMRALGVSLDKATLQQTLYDAGINRTFDSLTRAQKTELYYYQIMKQTESIQSQLGKTMASPANMTRVLKQEFLQLGRAIGSVFIPIAMKIIPVIRAIVQELINLANWLAQGKMKFNINDYMVDMSDNLIDIGDGLEDIEDGANDATRAMNRMLMPFDELNNITFSSKNGSGLGGIGAGGSLFEDLPKYDIFKYVSDDINDNVDKIKAKIESMLPVIKGIGIAIASAFAVIKVAQFLKWISDVKTALTNIGITSGMIKTGLGILFTIGGIWAQWQGRKKLLNGDYSLSAILETLGGNALGTFGIVSILRQFDFKNGVATLNSLGNQIKFGAGIMMAIDSFQIMKEGLEKQDFGKMLYGALKGGFAAASIASSLGANGKITLKVGVASTFILAGVEMALQGNAQGIKGIGEEIGGYLVTGISAAIATGNPLLGLVGAAATFAANYAKPDISGTWNYITKGGLARDIQILTGNYKDLNEESIHYINILNLTKDEMNSAKEKMQDLIDSYNNTVTSIENNRDATLRILQTDENYIKILDSLFDSNGKVISGQEKRVDFILNELNNSIGTELKLDDDLILKNGDTGESYNQIKDNLEEVIKKKKEDAEETAKMDLYKEAYEQRQRMSENLSKAATDYSNLLKQYREDDKNGLIKNNSQRKEWEQKLRDSYANVTIAAEGYQDSIDTLRSRTEFAFGDMAQTIIDSAPQIYGNSKYVGNQVDNGVADGIAEGTNTWKLKNAVSQLVNKVTSFLTGKTYGFDVNSPSKLMRDKVGYWLPLGIAEGIDKGAFAIEDSIQDLVNKTRIDMQDFNFDNTGNLISNINGNISAKTSASLSENAMDSMANATYEGMARALTENNEDYNPQFNVYVGNDKVYSGFGNYQSNESNRYGVKV